MRDLKGPLVNGYSEQFECSASQKQLSNRENYDTRGMQFYKGKL